LPDFLLDEREIPECLSAIHWLPLHIKYAKPGDEDFLAEIQEIESLQKFLSDHVTNDLGQEVVIWLQVSSDSFLEAERRVIPR